MLLSSVIDPQYPSQLIQHIRLYSCFNPLTSRINVHEACRERLLTLTSNIEKVRKFSLMVTTHDDIKQNTSVDFTDVGNGKWLCNICIADVMTIRQAVTHESSAQHSSRAEAYGLQATSSDVRNPTCDILTSLRRAEQERSHWMDLTPNLISFWHRGVVAAERGEAAESMQEFLDKLEEELRNSQGPWGSPLDDDGWGWGSPAEDWTPAPDVWASAWGTPIVPQVPKKVHRRREGSSSITSMHQEGTIPERNGAHVGDNQDDNTSFVENYLQHHAVDARRREIMRNFYVVRHTFMTYNFCLLMRNLFKMPTEQKIRKIHEVISDLRG